MILALSGIALLLFTIDILSYAAATNLTIDRTPAATVLSIDGQTLDLGIVPPLTTIAFAAHDPVVHEYQIDGTDSTNNFSLDTLYLNGISDTPYYRFQAWMRDLNSMSHWRDLRVMADGQHYGFNDQPPNGSQFALPVTTHLRITVALQRPETPMAVSLHAQNGTNWTITLDRNDHIITVVKGSGSNGSGALVAHTYFPHDPAPFTAEILDFLARTLLWSLAMLTLIVLFDGGTVLVFAVVPGVVQRFNDDVTLMRVNTRAAFEQRLMLSRFAKWLVRQRSNWTWQRLTRAIHPIGLVALVLSFGFVCWIALAQYHAQPHIYDASAYLWSARLYSSGHLTAPLVAANDRFPGPFMLERNGQRFTQYEPMTALTLVPGVLLGVPWLTEPLLGTLALLGIGLIAARLFDRRIATIAVILGTLSPFYSYLAASYMSHAISLFYIVWGFYALLRFAQNRVYGWLPVVAVLDSMAWLTRDIALVVVALCTAIVLALYGRQLLRDVREWWHWGMVALTVVVVAFGAWAMFNLALTGAVLTTPRTLFAPTDHVGFGLHIGFYGQHTVAGGLVTLNELLTSLAIDLFGWPFYLTLAFLALPFLTGRARTVDWLLLGSFAVVAVLFIGYFYHGIYLGPRYLFETLPFLLILTARGIVTLAETGVAIAGTVSAWLYRRTTAEPLPLPRISIATVGMVAFLVLCNAAYFLPRQIIIHRDFTGLPAGVNVDLERIYYPNLHHAIVMISDFTFYEYVLFPLNDPLLHGDVLYALAGSPDQFRELRIAYPDRTLYILMIDAKGKVSYLKM